MHTSITERWASVVKRSYAHNSRLYDFFAERSSGEAIHEFLRWDAEQPPFFRFLQGWLPKVHPAAHDALEKHIREELEEDHAGLFQNMMAHLAKHFPIAAPVLDAAKLKDLNYTFSRECAESETFEFFCGAFYATEVMSGKRCGQLFHGLRRLGVPERDLEYLRLHYMADQSHSEQVFSCFILPILRAGADPNEIERGIMDRLMRSEHYLRWYESTKLDS